MQQTNSTPLWRELNEKRTQKVWDSHANNEIHPTNDEDGVFIIADFSNFDIDGSVPKSEQAANAQYTALAVNNLHKLAEALEAVTEQLTVFSDMDVTNKNMVKESLQRAKEALASIS